MKVKVKKGRVKGEVWGIGIGFKHGIRIPWELSIRLGVEGKKRKRETNVHTHILTHTYTHACEGVMRGSCIFYLGCLCL